MSRLGIMASQISGHLVTNSYESIATISGSGSSLTFSSIPAGYKHLQIRGILQTSGGDTEAKMTFNGDTTSSNYATHQIVGSGSTPVATATANSGFIKTGITNMSSGSYYGAFVIDILDYSSTTKAKTARTLTGIDNNGGGYMRLSSGAWFSTSAVTSITFTPSGGSFNTYTQFALYGIRG